MIKKTYFRYPYMLIVFLSALLSFLSLGIIGCNNGDLDYRELMKDFVLNISSYANQKKGSFIIVPQNGHELLTKNGEPDGEPDLKYITAINGIGREDLFYGYNNDNEATPQSITNEIIPFLDIAKDSGLSVLVTDYCWDADKIDESYSKNNSRGYISFAADHRNLDDIPSYPPNPYNKNNKDIKDITGAMNFLYLINPDTYSSKGDFITALKSTNYDLLIVDLFFNEEQLTSNDVAALKVKQNGGLRLVICYMSIGEAEDYRYYWQDEWKNNPPDWLLGENHDWPGNYKVKYWDPEWQSIIYGNNNSYLDKIISAGFDGVYLDLIDAYEYFEDN